MRLPGIRVSRVPSAAVDQKAGFQFRRARLGSVLYSPVIHESTEYSRIAGDDEATGAHLTQNFPPRDSATAVLQVNEFGQRRAQSKGMTRGYSVFGRHKNYLLRFSGIAVP